MPVDPRTPLVEVLRAALVGDGVQRSDRDVVVQRTTPSRPESVDFECGCGGWAVAGLR